MACKDVVLTSTCHVGIEAAVVHAETLYHLRSACIKDTQSSQLCCGFVAAQCCDRILPAIVTPVCHEVHMVSAELCDIVVHSSKQADRYGPDCSAAW